jgi:hypothetical protein
MQRYEQKRNPYTGAAGFIGLGLSLALLIWALSLWI